MKKSKFLFFLGFWMACSSPALHQEYEKHSQENVFNRESVALTIRPNVETPSRQELSKQLEKYLTPSSALPDFFPIPKNFSATTAEARLKEEVNIEDVLAFICTRNREILAMKQSYLAVYERYPQALELTNNLQQYESFTTEIGITAPLNQSYPSPGLLGLKAEIILKETRIAHLQFQKTVRNKIARAKEIYASLSYLEKSIETTKKTIELLRFLENTVREKYKTGETGQVALLKIQVQILELDNELITLEQQRQTEQIALNLLMDFPPTNVLGKWMPLTFPTVTFQPEQLTEWSLKYQQEIILLKQQKEKMEQMIDLAERMTYPVVTGKGSKFLSRPPLEPMPMNPMINTFFGVSQAFIQEMKINVKGMEEQILEAENQAKLMIEEMRLKLDTQQRLEQLYKEELIPQATQSWNVTQTAYFNGKSDFLNVIDALRILLKFQLQETKAETERYKAFAFLEKNMGILFSSLETIGK